jgi:hypothetical protein
MTIWVDAHLSLGIASWISDTLGIEAKALKATKMEVANRKESKSMAVRQRRYSKEDMAQRGQALYESGIRQQVEAGNDGKIVAIDIETGAFEVDENIVPATNRLFEQYPDAQPWVIRIGHRAVYHFGARSLKKNP